MYHRLKIVYDVMNAQVCMCMCECGWVFGWPWIGFGMFNVLVRVSVCVRGENVFRGMCLVIGLIPELHDYFLLAILWKASSVQLLGWASTLWT